MSLVIGIIRGAIKMARGAEHETPALDEAGQVAKPVRAELNQQKAETAAEDRDGDGVPDGGDGEGLLSTAWEWISNLF